MYTEWQYNDELYHHGILGQKWGVRRYQNANGTLTEEGKKRYSSSNVKMRKISKDVVNNSEDISKQMASLMVKDLNRWGYKTTSKTAKSIQKAVNENIKKHEKYQTFLNKDLFEFMIDGVKEYSDSMPLTVEYNHKTKKVKDFWYT